MSPTDKRKKAVPSTALVPFEDVDIRRTWHNDTWYYAVVDIIAALTSSPSPRQYWGTLKGRLKGEGSEVLTDCLQLKFQAGDGKLYLSDAADAETVLRLIQSIPSPKAEPFKMWLAQVGTERLEEADHPEVVFERMKQNYRDQGYSEEWIEARMHNALTRNNLTDEWRERGAQERQYPILTNTIAEGTFGVGIQEHKEIKQLTGPAAKANLRDHMSDVELALSTLGEATAAEMHRKRNSQGFPPLHRDAQDAGKIAGNTRREIEEAIDGPVVTSENRLAQIEQSKARRAIRKDTSTSKLKGKRKQLEEKTGPSLFDQLTDNET